MKNQDQQLNQLYQDEKKAQPPKSIDEAILARAEDANQKFQYRRLRPWLAAASILFAVPILWLMVQQPEMQQSINESLQPEPIPNSIQSSDSNNPSAAAQSYHEVSESPTAMDTQDRAIDFGKIAVTGSRVKRQDTESDNAGLTVPSENKQTRSTPATEAKKQAPEPQIPEPMPEFEEEIMNSLPVPYSPLSTQTQKISATISIPDLIKHLKPRNLTATQQELWRKLQQQLDKQQWQQSLKTLDKLEINHPDIDFSILSEYLERLTTDE